MEHRQIVEELVKRAKGGQIACRQCLALAKEYDVPPPTVGEVCNEHGIRIRSCQLGCFQ